MEHLNAQCDIALNLEATEKGGDDRVELSTDESIDVLLARAEDSGVRRPIVLLDPRLVGGVFAVGSASLVPWDSVGASSMPRS
jgi:hypothetical protein